MRTGLDSRELLARQVKVSLDMLILAVLNGEPMHGYDILAIIHKKFGVLLSPGTLYPLLHSLARAKLIAFHSSRWKKVYTVEPKGKEELIQSLLAYRAVCQNISGFINERLKTDFPSPPPSEGAPEKMERPSIPA